MVGTDRDDPAPAIRATRFAAPASRGSSLISYLVVLNDGSAIETALIGREGAIGGIVSQGALPARFAGYEEVQLGGAFFRTELQAIWSRRSCGRPTRCGICSRAMPTRMMAQVFQPVACNAAHSIEQRTAKWLLAAIARTGASGGGTDAGAVVGDPRRRPHLSRPDRSTTCAERGVIEARRRGEGPHRGPRRGRAACSSPRECNAAVQQPLRGRCCRASIRRSLPFGK